MGQIKEKLRAWSFEFIMDIIFIYRQDTLLNIFLRIYVWGFTYTHNCSYNKITMDFFIEKNRSWLVMHQFGFLYVITEMQFPFRTTPYKYPSLLTNMNMIFLKSLIRKILSQWIPILCISLLNVEVDNDLLINTLGYHLNIFVRHHFSVRIKFIRIKEFWKMCLVMFILRCVWYVWMRNGNKYFVFILTPSWIRMNLVFSIIVLDAYRNLRLRW